MSLTSKKVGNTYGDLLHINNSNSGIDATVRTIQSGEGTSSPIQISTSRIVIVPASNSVQTIRIRNAADSATIMDVDTTNSEVIINNAYVNTRTTTFSLRDFSPSAGTHYPMIMHGGLTDSAGGAYVPNDDFGTGTDPDTSQALNGIETRDVLPCMYFLEDGMTIEQVRVVATSDNTTASTLNFHLYSFEMDNTTAEGSGSTAGALTDGTLLAHNGSVLTVDSYGIYQTTLTIDSTDVEDVSDGDPRIIMCFVEAVTINGDITAQVQVKHHIKA